MDHNYNNYAVTRFASKKDSLKIQASVVTMNIALIVDQTVGLND